ncbi:RHS repeat-associated core domain-containing protein [uncultured Pseudodesulfovibrio sp.]|uniref:RHS repeat domain-containing protein n=1 Tax=uncultured Pseudodesulfovibrio sp. TaxID=2035858 RepID=UPI0029C671CC|nr:RHS repeat-associated core domain-containing protein [uncultured Pseudodesulfovibrio sp.]
MKNPYSYTLNHDPQGRIIEKTEKVAGEPVTWTYAYDKAGRLAKCERNGWPVCDCWYDRAGRRACDSFPKSVEGDLRRYEYDMDNRLSRAGKNSYMHDENGFRSMWNHKGKYTLYEYSSDYRLLKADQKDEGRTFTFRHDDEGRRIAKYCNGELVEAYEWLDFIRLAGYWDGRNSYEFAYEDDERTPFAIRRDDGAVAYLFHDQVGSLRVVADTSGNMIKAIQYDPFGGIIEDSNPDFAIPLGFAGGLHDRDLGFVRFGFRDYDTYTSRWTAPDPIGDAGRDSDWYGYCLDDPVNANDPLGLFRFGKRPLDFLPESWHGVGTDGSTADKGNYELKHEHGFYEDGTGDNVGLGSKGKMTDEDITQYKLGDTRFDDNLMREAEKSLDPGNYKLLKMGSKSNNCQDYADRLRERYRFLRTAKKH